MQNLIKKIFLLLIVTITLTTMSNAQCKPLDFATLKSWLMAADNTKDALFTKAGFKKVYNAIDPEAGPMYNYSACWVSYKDGYARFAEQVAWYPKYKMISFNTLNKTNFDEIRATIKKTAKYKGTADDKTESYEDATYIYTAQVVDFNEPLQKIHPSYVVGIAPL